MTTSRAVGAGRSESGAGRYRVALYSHDTLGLGHVRRNLLIAQTLARSGLEPTILMLAGAREAGAFALPPGVDCVTLPALQKDGAGAYGSRHLGVSLPELLSMRSRILLSALTAFAPDLLVVDNVPRGALFELDPALKALRAEGCTRCVLGLRDVRDNPEAVRREWLRDGGEEAMRDYYDEVWVYGDPQVYDLIGECGYSALVASKARYTGYLDQQARLASVSSDRADAADLGLPPGKLALCMVGGGQDGAKLATAFAHTPLPQGYNGLLLTGPFMPGEVKRQLQAGGEANPRLRVLDFVPEPTPLLKSADRVITMGGYNSVCEVLSFEKPALIVPRVAPRREQWIRAERLQRLGLTDVLHPDDARPEAIAAWLAREVATPQVRSRINLGGLAALPGMVRDLLRPAPTPAPRYAHA